RCAITASARVGARYRFGGKAPVTKSQIFVGPSAIRSQGISIRIKPLTASPRRSTAITTEVHLGKVKRGGSSSTVLLESDAAVVVASSGVIAPLLPAQPDVRC